MTIPDSIDIQKQAESTTPSTKKLRKPGSDADVSAIQEVDGQKMPDNIGALDVVSKHLHINRISGPWDKLWRPVNHYVLKKGLQIVTPKGKSFTVTKLTTLPFWVSALSKDVITGREVVEVSWLEDTKTRSYLLQDQQLCDSRILRLLISEVGMPLNLSEVSKLLTYIHEVVAYAKSKKRDDAVPIHYVVSRLGWSTVGDKQVCVCGPSDNVEFSPPADFEEHSECLRSRGSLKVWIDNLRPHLEREPGLVFFMLASLASPLLSVLRCPGFVVETNGISSSGKTTSLRLAASVWGNTVDRENAATLLTTLNTTNVAFEVLYGFHRHLPVFVVDLHTVRKDSVMLKNFAYVVEHGQGKTRSNVNVGLRKKHRWQLISILDGERSITASYTKEGAHARTLSWRGSPIENGSPEIFKSINETVTENYALLGREFLRVVEAIDKQNLRAEFKARQDELRSRLNDSILNRSAPSHAALWTALQIVCKVPGMEWLKDVGEKALDYALRKVSAELAFQIKTQNPLDAIRSWRAAYADHFGPTPKQAAAKTPAYGFVTNDGDLAVDPIQLERYFKELNYDMAVICEKWRVDGVLALTSSRKSVKKPIRWLNGMVYMIVIKKEALDVTEEPELKMENAVDESAVTEPCDVPVDPATPKEPVKVVTGVFVDATETQLTIDIDGEPISYEITEEFYDEYAVLPIRGDLVSVGFSATGDAVSMSVDESVDACRTLEIEASV